MNTLVPKESLQIKNSIQAKFFEHLKNTIGPAVSLQDEVADALDVKRDSAYRRIRGETILSIDEAFTLCKHFKIPLEMLAASDTNNVTFAYESFGANNLDINAYLRSIINNLQQLKKLPNIHIYFAAEFVPVFHHFDFEEMTALKFFYWQKSIVNDEKLTGKKFDFKTTSEETLKLAKKAAELYNQIPSTEIWNVETINSTAMQILYYWDAGLFSSKEDALLICEQLTQMVEHIQQKAERGLKKADIPFNMYASEVMIGNNSVLGVAEDFKLSLLTFNTFNSLTTTNSRFCEESEIWMKNMMRKSMLLSGVSEKQRFQFFQKIFNVIEGVKMKIEGRVLVK